MARQIPYRRGADPVIARAAASRLRRAVAAALLATFGVLMAAQGVLPADRASPGGGWLVLPGALLMWLAVRIWGATAAGLELTRTELRDSTGLTIARVADIVAVRRGMASLRPANGFALTMIAAAPLVWRPGLWWRVGRRVGVGGLVPRREASEMAEALALLVAGRDA